MPRWWLFYVSIAAAMRGLAWVVTWTVLWAVVVAIAFGILVHGGPLGAVAIPWMASTAAVLVVS